MKKLYARTGEKNNISEEYKKTQLRVTAVPRINKKRAMLCKSDYTPQKNSVHLFTE